MGAIRTDARGWPAFQISFWRQRGGAVAVLIGVAIVPLIAVMGLAVDAGRAYLVQTKMSHAVDAAALAGGKAIFASYRDEDVQKLFDANFPANFLDAAAEPLEIVADPAGEDIQVVARATVPTTFLKVLGVPSVSVSVKAVVHRAVRGMELVLVMDNTGSMRSGGKMDAMKAAARDLIDILYGENETIENFWVGLAPYTATVNIGASRTAWLEGYDAEQFAPAAWKGCVEARAAPYDGTDDPPSVMGWRSFLYAGNTDNDWPPILEENSWQNDGRGPNLGCGPAITPLVAEKSTIQASIDEMLPWHRGGTMTNLGLAWGWRLLSPRWRGLWGGATPGDLPLDYGTPLIDKVVVILTDGVNQFYDHPPSGPVGSDYTAYRRREEGVLGTTSWTGVTNEINGRMAATCAAMKAEGVVIYAITFKLSDGGTKALFEGCATTPDHYFDSPSNDQLSAIFQEIGTELSNLRLAQ